MVTVVVKVVAMVAVTLAAVVSAGGGGRDEALAPPTAQSPPWLLVLRPPPTPPPPQARHVCVCVYGCRGVSESERVMRCGIVKTPRPFDAGPWDLDAGMLGLVVSFLPLTQPYGIAVYASFEHAVDSAQIHQTCDLFKTDHISPLIPPEYIVVHAGLPQTYERHMWYESYHRVPHSNSAVV